MRKRNLFSMLVLSLAAVLIFTACSQPELSKEELETAFSATQEATDVLTNENANFQLELTIKMTSKATEEGEEDETIEMSATVTVEGRKMKMIQISKSGTETQTNEVYYEIEDDSLFVYSKQSDVWTKTEQDISYFSNVMSLGEYNEYLEIILEDYEFKNGRYYAKTDTSELIELLGVDEAEGITIEMYFTVANGKIEKFVCSVDSDEGSMGMTMTYKFGSVTVALPTVTE